MMELPYNRNDKNSIIAFAKKFIGKSIISEYEQEIPLLNVSEKDKGQLGKVIEELYFKYKPNSNSSADFKEAGLEIKSSGLKQLANSEYRAKERLVLNIINYFEIVEQNFENDFLIGKNAHLLLIFYLYQKKVNQLSSIIKLVGDWKYPQEDIEIIRNDWELIKKKVLDGKAHELSESDTFYLGAATKGGKGGNPRNQPNNNLKAKQRAFSLKQGYVNHILASISQEPGAVYGKIIKSANEVKSLSIEEIVTAKFNPYYGKSLEVIVNELGIDFKAAAKDSYANLTKAILGISLDKEIEEFRKADVIIRTVRLDEKNLPKENISFPAFKFEELIAEKWETSELKEILDRKFLFVFFQFKDSSLLLRKARFWNMTETDLQKVKSVWEQTINVVKSGNIVREVKIDRMGNPYRKTNFPKKSSNSITHVRPHATTSMETFPLPVMDKVTGQSKYTKHSFWLNDTYVRDEIFLKP